MQFENVSKNIKLLVSFGVQWSPKRGECSEEALEMRLLPMSLVENQSVSSMCSLQCQRVTWGLTKGNLSLLFFTSYSFLFFHTLSSHPPSLTFFSITASSSFISSSIPLLKPQIISCNYPSLPSHTHTRDVALLLTTAGDHLT